MLGLQCGSFTFTWRCRGGQGGPSWAGDCGTAYSQLAAAGGGRVPLPPPGAYSIYANIDGMLVREQMMHEDQETPWMCKVRGAGREGSQGIPEAQKPPWPRQTGGRNAALLHLLVAELVRDLNRGTPGFGP